MLDLVEKKILNWGIPIFFLAFLFLPFPFKFPLLYFSSLVFFVILFFLCSYWANEYYPEKKFLIGFLVSILHSFLFFLAGSLGMVFSLILLKFFPLIFEFLKGILPIYF